MEESDEKKEKKEYLRKPPVVFASGGSVPYEAVAERFVEALFERLKGRR